MNNKNNKGRGETNYGHQTAIGLRNVVGRGVLAVGLLWGARGRRRQVINMIKQFIKGRVYVFIDAENVFYSQRTLGWRISYEKLMKYFKKECGDDVKCFI